MVTEEQLKQGSVPKSNTVENIKSAVKNTADLSIMMPVVARVRKRLTELKEKSSAKHMKIKYGNSSRIHTEAPEMFISGLSPSITNNRGVITYSVYKKDKDGNKALHKNYADVERADGTKRKIVADAHYILEKDVVETFEDRKPMTTEEFKNE